MHGGFISGADRFDHSEFGVSLTEASAMDPQQRLLLEESYSALIGAGHGRAALLGSVTGVFVGIERPDWALIQVLTPSSRSSAYAATRDTASIAAGRLSFVLGLHGQCLSVDTACSSAMVALQGAVDALHTRTCCIGVASGVSLKLAPHVTVTMSGAGMLSVDGRCKTFDASANGYVRSEGIGSSAVQPLLSVQHVASGTPQLLHRGGAVRQDGRSASITAPNGSAQRELKQVVLEQAKPLTVCWVEAHGTGTALGDPTEVSSLVAALGPQMAFLLAGAAKANAGHSEAASGLLGVTKAACQLSGKVAMGNAKLRSLNLHLAPPARANGPHEADDRLAHAAVPPR